MDKLEIFVSVCLLMPLSVKHSGSLLRGPNYFLLLLPGHSALSRQISNHPCGDLAAGLTEAGVSVCDGIALWPRISPRTGDIGSFCDGPAPASGWPHRKWTTLMGLPLR